MAIRAALIRLASVDSETIRPFQTAVSKSSRLTIRSRFRIRNSNRSKTWGSTERNSPSWRSSRRSVSIEKLSNENSSLDAPLIVQTGECRRQYTAKSSRPECKWVPSQGGLKALHRACWHIICGLPATWRGQGGLHDEHCGTRFIWRIDGQRSRNEARRRVQRHRHGGRVVRLSGLRHRNRSRLQQAVFSTVRSGTGRHSRFRHLRRGLSGPAFGRRYL